MNIIFRRLCNITVFAIIIEFNIISQFDIMLVGELAINEYTPFYRLIMN